jgi:hypothetical protein
MLGCGPTVLTPDRRIGSVGAGCVCAGFTAIFYFLEIDSIFDGPIQKLVMFDPSRRVPRRMPLSRTSDTGSAVFASTRGWTLLDNLSSLSFALSYLTSLHAMPVHGRHISFTDSDFPLPNLI